MAISKTLPKYKRTHVSSKYSSDSNHMRGEIKAREIRKALRTVQAKPYPALLKVLFINNHGNLGRTWATIRNILQQLSNSPPLMDYQNVKVAIKLKNLHFILVEGKV